MKPSRITLTRLTHIHPASLARMVALLTLVFSLVTLLPTSIVGLVKGGLAGTIPTTTLETLGFIIIYTAFAYVCGLLLAIVYNILAKYKGGIEFELTEERPE